MQTLLRFNANHYFGVWIANISDLVYCRVHKYYVYLRNLKLVENKEKSPNSK
jgi:hypothetical protein